MILQIPYNLGMVKDYIEGIRAARNTVSVGLYAICSLLVPVVLDRAGR